MNWEAAVAADATHYMNLTVAVLTSLILIHPSIRRGMTANSICSAARSRLARFGYALLTRAHHIRSESPPFIGAITKALRIKPRGGVLESFLGGGGGEGAGICLYSAHEDYHYRQFRSQRALAMAVA